MGRPLRVNLGGYAYHCLNRGNGRAGQTKGTQIFFAAFGLVPVENRNSVPAIHAP